jgi:pyruvate,water dikinase
MRCFGSTLAQRAGKPLCQDDLMFETNSAGTAGSPAKSSSASRLVLPLSAVGMKDVAVVGGKNASLGELTRNLKSMKIHVPEGFATTAEAYRQFIAHNRLAPAIARHLERFDKGRESLQQCGAEIRRIIASGDPPDDLRRQILDA